MTNYVKATNFTSKDALASGDPLKIVRGSEIDTEFNAIATAVSSKANTTDVPTNAGSGASGTWGISISGNAATATTATSSTNLSGGASGNIPYQTGAGTTAFRDAATTFSAIKQSATDSVTGVVELATTAEASAGVDTTRAVTAAGVKAAIGAVNAGITLMAAQATTSGTSFDFTGIPATTRRITVLLDGVSTNGASNFFVQIGSGSVQVAGYASAASVGTASTGQKTTGFVAASNIGPGSTWSGSVNIVHFGGNKWIMSAVTNPDNSSSIGTIATGTVTLVGSIDRLRFTTENGTDTFDAGNINVMYE